MKLSLKSGARQRGVTLMEVLVSILIVSFGLLGFVGLQARAIAFSLEADDSNRAALLAQEMASTMIALGTVDTNDEALAIAISKWRARAGDGIVGLPHGAASVVSVGNRSTITVTWQVTGATTAASNKYTTQVIIP